jgi:hydrogenase maturation factor
MFEVVGEIMDEGSTMIARNSMSRRLDELPEEETQAQTEVLEEVEVQPEVVEEAMHDEL